MFSHNPLRSWRCRRPPGTQWDTLHNSGTHSPQNSQSKTSLKSLCLKSTGHSVAGAAFQMLILR